MKIKLTSIFVNNHYKALKFYTEVLGFVKKREIPEIRWLTVVSPEDSEGPELLLESNNNPAAKTYQKSIFKKGILQLHLLWKIFKKNLKELKRQV